MNLAGVVCFMLMVFMVSPLRVKRMLYGDFINSFGNDFSVEKYISPYDALYYTVAMKPAWGRAVYAMEWNDPVTSWNAQVGEGPNEQRAEALAKPRNNRCGGAFLTPQIVQTACHCVAHFYSTTATNKVVWEEPLVIYAAIGYSQRGELWGPGIYSPRRYYAHKNCKLWRAKTTRVVSYDYALITLAKGHWGIEDAPSNFPRYGYIGDPVRTAPLYTAQDLDKHYLNIMQKQAICLFMGHGYSTLGNSSGLLSIYRPASANAVMDRGLPRHTWRAITGYRFCHDFLESVVNLTNTIDYLPKGDQPIVWEGPEVRMLDAESVDTEIFHPEYTAEATFTCSMNAGKFQAIPVVGDGGYPVTCNNVYFAIQGIGWTKWNKMDRMSVESAIVYAKYENSADFRDDLLVKIDEWGPHNKKAPRHLHFEERSNLENILQNSGRKASKFPVTLILLVAVPSPLIRVAV